LTERWRVPIPVEGFNFMVREKFNIQGATVETLHNGENIMEPMISVNVDGDSESAWISGKALIDRIAARLSYSTGLEIRLKKEVYLSKLQPETDTEKKRWGYHRHFSEVEVGIPIGDHHKAMVSILMELENVKTEKQVIVDKAVAYYREALSAKNPFQKIITLFSCITVIVRDVV
jgi:hypothetical protein